MEEEPLSQATDATSQSLDVGDQFPFVDAATPADMQEDSMPLQEDFFGDVDSTTATPRPVILPAVEERIPTAARDDHGFCNDFSSYLAQGDFDADTADHPPQAVDENAEVQSLIQKAVQTWTTECAVPELTMSLFVTPEGMATSELLQQTDGHLQQMVPSLDIHERLTLCVNERAMKRLCHVMRQLKARRRSKLLTEPVGPLVWQEAVIRECENCSNEMDASLLGANDALEQEEYELALQIKRQLELSKVNPPLLGAHPDVLHFEVISPDLTKQKFLDAAAAAATAVNSADRAEVGAFKMQVVSRLLDGALRQRRLTTDRRREAAATPLTATTGGGGSQFSASTPWGTFGGASSNPSSATHQTPRAMSLQNEEDVGIPLGTILTLDYAIAQDLLHEGHLCAYM